MDGEHDTASEAICYAPIVVSYHQTGLLQVFSLITFAHGFFIQRIALIQAISQLELANGIFPKPALGKVTQADSPSLNVVLEQRGEIFASPRINDEHTFTVVARLLLSLGQLPLVYFNMIFLSQPAKGIKIAQLFVLHDEMHRRSPFPTSKALADVLCWRDIK